MGISRREMIATGALIAACAAADVHERVGLDKLLTGRLWPRHTELDWQHFDGQPVLSTGEWVGYKPDTAAHPYIQLTWLALGVFATNRATYDAQAARFSGLGLEPQQAFAIGDEEGGFRVGVPLDGDPRFFGQSPDQASYVVATRPGPHSVRGVLGHYVGGDFWAAPTQTLPPVLIQDFQSRYPSGVWV